MSEWAEASLPRVHPQPTIPTITIHLYAMVLTWCGPGRERSHLNMVSNVCQLNSTDSFARFAFGPDDVLLGILPLYHIYGMTVLMCGALAQGATLVLVPKFDPASFLKVFTRRSDDWRRYVPLVLTHNIPFTPQCTGTCGASCDGGVSRPSAGALLEQITTRRGGRPLCTPVPFPIATQQPPPPTDLTTPLVPSVSAWCWRFALPRGMVASQLLHRRRPAGTFTLAQRRWMLLRRTLS